MNTLLTPIQDNYATPVYSKKNKTSPYFSPAPDNFDHESNKKYTFISIHDQIIHLPVN